MSHHRTVPLLLAAMFGVLFAIPVLAGDQPLVGIVNVAASNTVEAATIKAGTVVYKVKKDDNGKTVAKEAKDKKVEFKGVVEDKAGVKWIAITSCKIVE